MAFIALLIAIVIVCGGGWRVLEPFGGCLVWIIIIIIVYVLFQVLIIDNL